MKKYALTASPFVGIILVVVLAVFLFAYRAPQTHSQGAGTHITGTAWSDAIGWIKLDCTLPHNDCSNYSYNLGVDSGGTITGYAWSDKGGWITAYNTGSTDAGACGAQASVNIGTGAVTGWLRQINIPGTDGCIKLNPTGSLYNGTSGDVKYASGAITGFGWGGDILGWVGFNAAADLTPADCTMNVVYPAPYSVFYGSALPPSFTITYTTQHAVGNVSVTNNNGSYAPSYNPSAIPSSGTSFTVTPPPSVDTTFTMTVTNSSGSQNTCPTTADVDEGFPPPSGSLSIGALTPVVKAASVKKGSTTALFWDITNILPNTCSITQNGNSWKSGGTAGNTMGTSTGPVTVHVEYVLTCTPQQAGATFIDRAVINILPEFQEI